MGEATHADPEIFSRFSTIEKIAILRATRQIAAAPVAQMFDLYCHELPPK